MSLKSAEFLELIVNIEWIFFNFYKQIGENFSFWPLFDIFLATLQSINDYGA